MMPFSFESTSSNVHDSLSEFWLISSAEVATPPALEALPGQNRTFFSKKYGMEGNYVAGANIAGFLKVAEAMKAQGIV